MKNLNEESEKLSHEEKSFNTPQNMRNSSQINTQHQPQLNNNQQIPQTHYHLNTNNLMNNFHMNHHHHNMHNQNNNNHSNIKYLYFMAKRYIYFGNMIVQNFFSNVTETLDLSINRSHLNPSIKKYIRTKQILIAIYILNIQYLISTVEKIYFLNLLNNISFFILLLSIFSFYLHYYFFKNKLFIDKDEDIEKFVSKRNPQIKKGKCEGCNIIKIMRSNHCSFCNHCVKKFHFHSDWFNICIGCNNDLLYGLTLFFIICYLFISNLIFWYYILFGRDLLNYLIFIFLLFAIIGIYINFISAKFLYEYIFKCLSVNLTYYEKNNFKRLNYLFGENMRRGIFNPFNKGFQRNLEELVINMFDVDIYKEYKNYGCQNLSEIIEETDTGEDNKKEEEFNKYYELNSFKLMLKLNEHFDPLISSKENIYKFVDGKEIINWNRLYIYTIFDVINSPFKDTMLKQAKFQIKQSEMYLNKMKNYNMNKEEKIDVNDSNKNEISTKEDDNKDNDKDDNKENDNESENKEDDSEENSKIQIHNDNNDINNNNN